MMHDRVQPRARSFVAPCTLGEFDVQPRRLDVRSGSAVGVAEQAFTYRGAVHCGSPTNDGGAQAPDISNREAGGYGTFASQYGKLERAYALDANAALQACSWGMFQILGLNHAAAGFGTVVDYVRAMCQSEAAHLEAFVAFVQASAGMHTALRNHDWAEFARRYNGPQFHRNHYDFRMADAYREAGGVV